MKGQRVFVSGGAGVIGLEIVPKLVARGAEVLVGDLKPRPPTFSSLVKYRHGDLNDMTRFELSAFDPDIFIHLAATFERSTETAAFWEENFRHNVTLSHHLMTLSRDQVRLRRVIFASSYLIYDPALYQFDTAQSEAVALKVGDPIQPRNLTGMAKLSHEMELRFLSEFHQFSTLCVRIYRGYGRNSRDVISRWVRSLLAGEEIAVFRPEGRFDYIYAKDTAEGLIRLAEAEFQIGIINLGTGHARSVADVLDVLKTHFPDMRLRHELANIPFEASQADTSVLRKALGWTPEYDLETAIPEIIDFERAKSAGVNVVVSRPSNVLITSASRKVPLIRAAQTAARKFDPTAHVIAGDVDPAALTRHVADDFWSMPRTTESEIDAIVKGCRDRGIGTIFPTRDGELLFWSQARDRFSKAGIDIVVSDSESVERCLDKLQFAAFGRNMGLPVIAAASHPDGIGPGPLVVKERFGAGSRNIGINLDRTAALQHGATLADPIYQPFVSGPEISIDAWLDDQGIPRGVVLRRRDKVVNGESEITTTFRDASLEAAVETALPKLRLRGPVVMQAILEPGTGLQIIECNARFGGASTTAISAGLDLLYWSILQSRDPDASPLFLRLPGELRQIRVPSDIIQYDPDF